MREETHDEVYGKRKTQCRVRRLGGWKDVGYNLYKVVRESFIKKMAFEQRHENMRE